MEVELSWKSRGNERTKKANKESKKSIILTNILEHLSPFTIHHECNLKERYGKIYSNQNHRENVNCHIWSSSRSVRLPSARVYGFQCWLLVTYYIKRMHVEYIYAWQCFLLSFSFHLFIRRGRLSFCNDMA